MSSRHREHAIQLALADLPRIIAQNQPGPHAPAIWLIMRSGVSATNDQEVGMFHDAYTGHLCGLFLLALDQADHPEYRGFDLVDTNDQVLSTYPS